MPPYRSSEAIRCAPLSSSSSTVEIAARPEAKAKPPAPPSRLATARSKAKRVGLWLRLYSKPLCSPGEVWA